VTHCGIRGLIQFLHLSEAVENEQLFREPCSIGPPKHLLEEMAAVHTPESLVALLGRYSSTVVAHAAKLYLKNSAWPVIPGGLTKSLTSAVDLKQTDRRGEAQRLASLLASLPQEAHGTLRELCALLGDLPAKSSLLAYTFGPILIHLDPSMLTDPRVMVAMTKNANLVVQVFIDFHHVVFGA